MCYILVYLLKTIWYNYSVAWMSTVYACTRRLQRCAFLHMSGPSRPKLMHDRDMSSLAQLIVAEMIGICLSTIA
jgi:hypothetical protein